MRAGICIRSDTDGCTLFLTGEKDGNKQPVHTGRLTRQRRVYKVKQGQETQRTTQSETVAPATPPPPSSIQLRVKLEEMASEITFPERF